MKTKGTLFVLLAILAWFSFQRKVRTEVISTIQYGEIFPSSEPISLLDLEDFDAN